ncbi:MAG: 4-hydroxy-tetrahydrodipicolinate reductase [Thermoanaerobaculia bacterium]|jgi:4-hydroxy-tetrahydrodipicolinate reductase|nr:4-hydroxy-tetrahydrodipicolinate reductase [Thermoanaerobaculia bacterium]
MKIAIHGYGKMGRTIEKVAKESGHEVVCILDVDRDEPLSGAEVIIDFSHASALDHTLDITCEQKIGLVIGTTGWNDRLDDVKQRVEQSGIACVYASNFSPGANVVFDLAQRAGALIGHFPQYAAGMEERHHDQKKDAPSGTALRIAAAVTQGSGEKLTPPIVSSRVGSEFGLHTLFFDSPDDLIEISHRARGREGFARGAVMAAQLLRGRKGLFRFDELVFGDDEQ